MIYVKPFPVSRPLFRFVFLCVYMCICDFLKRSFLLEQGDLEGAIKVVLMIVGKMAEDRGLSKYQASMTNKGEGGWSNTCNLYCCILLLFVLLSVLFIFFHLSNRFCCY